MVIMNKDDEMIKLSHKMLNRFILRAKEFCEKFCVPDGLSDILKTYRATGVIPEKLLFSKKLAYDYDYFAFTKSTKSLIAIKHLLNDKSYYFNEDCFMLIRSIFECHIMSRYVRDHIDIENEKQHVIKKFIVNPLSVTYDYFSLQGNSIIDQDGKRTGIIPMPHNFTMGYDQLYYSDFYQFLCQYTHCSFGALTCYFGNELFTFRKKNFSLLTLLFVLFVFTKIYEGVVTVTGEDLGEKSHEKIFYDLAYDSLELQIELFEYLIRYYENKPKENINSVLEKYLGTGSYDDVDNKIAKMLINMKKSLFDTEIGSLNKNIIDGRFDRCYPLWE